MVWQRMPFGWAHTDVDCFNAGGHQTFQLLSHAGVFLWRFAAVAATQKSAEVNVLSGQWPIQNAGDAPHVGFHNVHPLQTGKRQ